MKKSIILFVLLVFAVNTTLKANEEKPRGKVTGTVIEQETGRPVGFASVAILDETQELVSGTITGDDGTFALNGLHAGEYQLQVSFVGFERHIVNPLKITPDNWHVALGKINIKAATAQIDEAVVTTERLKGEEKADRTVFTVNENLRKAASKGLDLIKLIPGIHVDFQENITLEGSGNILIYVDDVERTKEFVAQLDPAMIDKVEIISNPGVKYDASVDGIIKIVLTKEKRYGINGSINTEIPNPNTILMNQGGNLEYGNQNFRVYAGNRLHYEKFSSNEDNILTYKDANSELEKFEQYGTGKNSWRNNFFNYGADWFISQKSALNLYGNISSHKSLYADFLSDNYAHFPDNSLNYWTTLKDQQSGGTSRFVSLFYKQELGEENKFTTEFNLYDYTSENNTDLLDTYYSDTSASAEIINKVLRNEQILNNRTSTEYKADLTFMAWGIKHETGLRNFLQWMKSREMDEGIENGLFEFSEWRQAGYYNLSGRIKELNYSGGLRLEHSSTLMENQTEASYWAFLPQLNLQYKLKEDQSLKATYSRNINRPGIDQLNPFEVWQDSLHVAYGNPDLEPAFYNKTEIKYTRNFKSNYISFDVFLNTNNNGIQQVNNLSGVGVFISRMANIGKSKEYGATASGAWQLTKWWRMHLWSQLAYHAFYENAATDRILTDKWSLNNHFTNIFTLPKDFTLFADLNYRTPFLSYQTVYARDPLLVTGVSKKFGKNWEVGGWYIPFVKEFTYKQTETNTPELKQLMKGQVHAENVFTIKISYKFNKGGKINKLNRKAEYEKDEGESLM